ncbi:MAG: hypothetical protein ABIP55_13620, partial [Tepidisphaeraceae bacterium]
MAARKKLRYLWSREVGRTFDYPVQAMQRALTARGVGHLRNDNALFRFLGRGFSKIGMMRHVADLSNTAYLAPIMQVTEARLFPVCYGAETIVYAMDCWPAKYDKWEAFFRRQRMKIAFITARLSAERMRQRVPGLDATWMPEAINPEAYNGDKPLAARSIDVLEMGRRYSAYHDTIRPHCETRKYDHRYEKVVGQIIFPTYDAFIAALGDSKVSICFPSSLTHPARSGDVETLTLRYLESIAARCILVGRCPAELKDLFGYNPMIEADLADPGGQLDTILADLSAHVDLVER